MNILVTGANGQLGTELRDVAAGSRDNYIFSDIISLPGVETLCLDITDIEADCLRLREGGCDRELRGLHQCGQG